MSKRNGNIFVKSFLLLNSKQKNWTSAEQNGYLAGPLFWKAEVKCMYTDVSFFQRIHAQMEQLEIKELTIHFEKGICRVHYLFA